MKKFLCFSMMLLVALSVFSQNWKKFFKKTDEVSWEEYQDVLRRLHECEDTPKNDSIVYLRVVVYHQREYVIQFGPNKFELTKDSKDILKTIPKERSLSIEAFSSINEKDVSKERAIIVENFLKELGHDIDYVHFHGALDENSASIVIISVN